MLWLIPSLYLIDSNIVDEGAFFKFDRCYSVLIVLTSADVTGLDWNRDCTAINAPQQPSDSCPTASRPSHLHLRHRLALSKPLTCPPSFDWPRSHAYPPSTRHRRSSQSASYPQSRTSGPSSAASTLGRKNLARGPVGRSWARLRRRCFRRGRRPRLHSRGLCLGLCALDCRKKEVSTEHFIRGWQRGMYEA